MVWRFFNYFQLFRCINLALNRMFSYIRCRHGGCQLFPFFVVFIMSQAFTTMAMTTSPPVTVECSGTLSLLSTVTMAPSLLGLPTTSGQHDAVLPPPLTPRYSGGVVGYATVSQQQPPAQMSLQPYAMGSPQVGFLSELSLPPFCIFIYLVSVLVYAFYFQVSCWMLNSPMGAQPLGFAPLQPFGAYPQQACMQPCDGHQPTPGMHRVAALSTTLSGGSLMLPNQLSLCHSNYRWVLLKLDFLGA